MSMNVAKQEPKYMIPKCITIPWRAAKGRKTEARGSHREPQGAKRKPNGSQRGANRGPKRSQKDAQMNYETGSKQLGKRMRKG